MWEGKPATDQKRKDSSIKVEIAAPKSSEEPVKEDGSGVHINGELKPAEKKLLVNGVVANGC